MTPPPVLYAEWAAALDRFAAGDDAVVAALEAGTFDWSAVAAERLTRRVHDAFFARMQAAQRALQRDLDHARGNEARMAQALVGVRTALGTLARVAAIRALAEPLRAHLAAELAGLAEGMQSSLETSARADRAAGERLLALVRANAIRVPTLLPPAPGVATHSPPPPPRPGPDGPGGGRRPIILG